ncbi:hypothetical protein Tco_1257401 [Tanacetum coccineum]
MYQDSWDKMIHTQCNARYEKLEKETQIKFSNLEECVRIKDRQHIIRANDDFIIFENLRAQVKELQSENEHLKSKVVDCTMCQNFQVQVEELKSVNESLNLSVEELSKARALVEATLRERDKIISAQCKKIRLLEEQSEIFHELNNLEKVYETKESELLEKIDQMESQFLELVEKLQISDQEMKQQIILFEQDKRMFLAKNEFLEKVSSSVQKEYNDLLASNDVLKQRIGTKFKFLKHDNSLEKMIEMIEKEYELKVSKISITSSTFETKNLELVKEMGDKVKCFEEKKKVFEDKISKLEKDLAQRVKDFDDVKTELSNTTDKFETTSYNVLKEKYENSCEKLEKENDDLKMHYKRLFDSIKQKKVDSQVCTKSIPKVNVSEKIYTGKSSKPISRKVSQFTTYSLQKDKKYLKKQHSSETFASQNDEKNESSKQASKRKDNISKRFKYSRSEMFSMRKRDDSVLNKVKDVTFPFISKRIFQNETPSFNNKWKSSSSSRVKTSNETPGFRTVLTPLKSFKTPNETSRFYKSK